MKVIENTDVSIDSNIEGRKIAMTMDPAAAGQLMQMMTRLYSDPLLAIVREYSTNADDAQIEVGVTSPIEVSLPNALAPFFRVKDHGVGLDAQGIEEVYSRYGASTKRGTNAQNGMLGMGCKSALAYTPQFTIVSVKAGVLTHVVVGYESDGAMKIPFMTIVDESPTSLPNGTEITIPVRRDDHDSIAQKAKEFFSYWQPGKVLLNGVDPSGLQDAIKVSDTMYVQPWAGLAFSRRADRVVMGGVAYPTNERISSDVNYGYSLVAFTPIGTCNFTPSREALEYTSATRQTLRDLRDEFQNSLPGVIQTQVDKAQTPGEAVETIVTLCAALPRAAHAEHYTFQGKTIPQKFIPKTSMVIVPGSSHKLSQHEHRATYYEVSMFPSTVWITDYDRPTFTAGQKKKINLWRATQEFDGKLSGRVNNYVLLPQGKAAIPFGVDASRVVSWKDSIEPIKLPRAASYRPVSTGNGKIPGSYWCYTGEGRRMEILANDIDQTKPVLFAVGSHQRALSMLFHLAYGDDYTLVTLEQNRKAKFLRLFPVAVPALDRARDLNQKWIAGLTQDQKDAIIMAQAGHTSDYANLPADKIKDPAIKKAIKLALTDANDQFKLHAAVFGSPRLGKLSFDLPLAKYPLYNSYYMRTQPNHVIAYLNREYRNPTQEV